MNFESLKKAVKHCDQIFKPRHNVYQQDFSRVLVVNLTEEKTEAADLPEEWISSYVSGPCMSARIWAQFCDEDDDSPVVITAPAARSGSAVSIAFKGFTSKKLVFNTINGDFAQKIKNCRFAAIVIKGRLRRQGIITISAGGAGLQMTESLRQSNCLEVIEKLCSDNYDSCLAVGPAGENGVGFASCVCDGEFTGRYGLGAVLGKKNIKAIKVTAFSEKFVPDPAIRKIPFVSIAGVEGWAPVRNFSARTDPRLFHLSESEFSRIFGASEKLPSYASRLMLGSNAGCFDIVKTVERYKVCMEEGLDPVAVGCILGVKMQGEKDNKKVCDFIKRLSFRTVGIDYPKLGSEACGPYDYRGNFVQAVSDLGGNFFPVIFNSNRLLASNHYDFWANLSEDLVLGLESFGLNPDCLYRRVRNVGRLKALHFKYNTKAADRYFSPEEQAEVLTKQFKTSLVGQDIIDLGRVCKRLIYEINKVLGDEEIKMPDHFCIEPETAHPEKTIVPVFSLMQDYRKRRDRLFAVQDSVLNKS